MPRIKVWRQMTIEQYEEQVKRLERPLFDYGDDDEPEAAPIVAPLGPTKPNTPTFAEAKPVTSEVELQEPEYKPVPYMRRNAGRL